NGAGGTIDDTANVVTFGNVDGTAPFTKVGAGVLTVNHVRSGGLTIHGGTAAIAANSTASGVSRVTTLTIDTGAKLDLADNKMIINSAAVGTATAGTYDGVTGLIQQGRGQGGGVAPFWTGTTGIVTTQSNAT